MVLKTSCAPSKKRIRPAIIWIETFWQYVDRWQNAPAQLKDILAGLNLRLETVSNGGHMRTSFADPAQRAGVVEDHMKLVNFIHYFGCDHLKINCGAPVKVSEAERSHYIENVLKLRV